jgi:hypothetical protein
MKVRKPTYLGRVTVDQQLQMVLDVEEAPAGTYRSVQLLIPNSPQFHFTIDHPTPNEAGPNRNYKTTPVPPGAQITFCLQPHQKLYAHVTKGEGFAGIIIEYLEED